MLSGRHAAGALCVLAGLLLAAAATHARDVVRGLPAPAAAGAPAAPSALGYDVGNDDPFAPFTFAVVGAVRGDHAALERAFALADERGASLTIVLGDLLPADGADVLPLAAVVAEHWNVTAYLPGPGGDMPAQPDPRIEHLLRAPAGWAFTHRGAVFRGWSDEESASVGRDAGLSGDAEFAFTTAPRSSTSDGEPAGVLRPPIAASAEEDLAVDLYHVRAPGDVEHESFTVSRGPSAASLLRDAELLWLLPAATPVWGLLPLLLAAAAVFAGLRLLRRRRMEPISAPRVALSR